jgi:hypothetical protein
MLNIFPYSKKFRFSFLMMYPARSARLCHFVVRRWHGNAVRHSGHYKWIITTPWLGFRLGGFEHHDCCCKPECCFQCARRSFRKKNCVIVIFSVLACSVM